MPTKTLNVTTGSGAPAVTSAVNLEREHQKGLALINPILKELEGLEVVDEPSYLEADAMLGKVRNSRKTWATIWSAIDTRIVKPLRESLDGAYAINREVDRPLEQAEKAIKLKMGAYKEAEARQIAAADREREQEAERLQAEIEDAARKEDAAKSPVMKRRMAMQREILEGQQQEVIETVALPVIGSAATTRVVTYPVVVNLQQLAVALLVGTLSKKESGMRARVIDAVNAVLKAEARTAERKAEIAAWPGCELKSETQIVGR